MKKEIRVLGIDDGPFDKFNDSEALVVGTVYRGGSFIDGVLSCKVKVDGNDSTEKIAVMVNNSKFRPQIQAILLDGVAVAGFNVIDVKELNEKTDIPVIIVMRNYPEIEKMKDALVNLGYKEKLRLIESAGEIHKLDEIFIQYIGLSLKEAEEIIDITSTHSLIPEPLRVAHLIARGVISGESKGKA